MDERLKKIADNYGYSNQSRQLLQEMAELQVEVTAEKPDIGNIAEELADVMNMCKQIAYLLGVETAVEQIAELKAIRQIGRMERENREKELEELKETRRILEEWQKAMGIEEIRERMEKKGGK